MAKRGSEQKAIFKDDSTANSSSARFRGLLVNSLKSIQNARADGEVVEAGGGAGGEVAAFDVDFDGQIGERFDPEAAGAAVDHILADRATAVFSNQPS